MENEKEAYLAEVEALKKKYKARREDLEFADDDFEEGLILEEMEKYRQNIKEIKLKLAQIEDVNKEASL